MVVIRKASDLGVQVVDVVLIRSFFISVTTVPFLIIVRKNPFRDVPSHLRCTLLMRCICGTIGLSLFVVVMFSLPAFIAYALVNTESFGAAILGYLIN